MPPDPEDDDDNTPNCFDLRGRIVDNLPQWAEATRYLDPSTQYKADLEQWRIAGSPPIEGELSWLTLTQHTSK